MSTYESLRVGDFIKVVEVIGIEKILEDCNNSPDTIVLGEEYFIESIDPKIQKGDFICGRRPQDYEEYTIGIALNGFWVHEDIVKVEVIKKNMKYED
jgi:hypothetical protein